MSNDIVVSIENTSIIFGDNPSIALEHANAGMSREEIQSLTGQILGVHACDLEVAEGEIVVLMGLSGSGKSTLLRGINGLNPISAGKIRVHDGKELCSVSECEAIELRHIRRQHVSMVFQQFGLLPWRSVRDNVAFGLEVAGLDKQLCAQRTDKYLALVNLQQWADKQVFELSGGMQQRVGLARAFCTQAPILLMDEPFSALDPLIRENLQQELLSFNRQLRKTIVFVSHDLDEAAKIGDRIAIMNGGRIVQLGTPQEIILHPANQYVADFVAHINLLNILTADDLLDRNLPHPLGERINWSQLQAAKSGANINKQQVVLVEPQTKVREVMDAMLRSDNDVLVCSSEDQQQILGVISKGAIFSSLLREHIERPVEVEQNANG